MTAVKAKLTVILKADEVVVAEVEDQYSGSTLSR